MKQTVENQYPLTIIADRYGGCYSHGKYLAFNVDAWDVPDPIGGSDPEEENFWTDPENSEYVGKGDTIMEAVENLVHKLNILRGEK